MVLIKLHDIVAGDEIGVFFPVLYLKKGCNGGTTLIMRDGVEFEVLEQGNDIVAKLVEAYGSGFKVISDIPIPSQEEEEEEEAD